MKLSLDESQKKREEIFQKYPELYEERNVTKGSGLSRYPIVYGFECGAGWLPLIDALSATIQWRSDQLKKKDPDFKPIKIFQCKEKFGQLRVSTSCHGDDFVWGAVSLAEFQSGKICETCGAEGTLRQKSWIYVACDSCHEEKMKSK